MPEKEKDAEKRDAGNDRDAPVRVPRKDTEKYVAVGQKLRVHVDSWDGQPEEALSRLVQAIDLVKAQKLGVEVRP